MEKETIKIKQENPRRKRSYCTSFFRKLSDLWCNKSWVSFFFFHGRLVLSVAVSTSDRQASRFSCLPPSRRQANVLGITGYNIVRAAKQAAGTAMMTFRRVRSLGGIWPRVIGHVVSGLSGHVTGWRHRRESDISTRGYGRSLRQSCLRLRSLAGEIFT